MPPDILDYPTSTDMVVREGSNVTLKCAATGSPEPAIIWRRENGVPIELANGTEGKSSFLSPFFFIVFFFCLFSRFINKYTAAYNAYKTFLLKQQQYEYKQNRMSTVEQSFFFLIAVE